MARREISTTRKDYRQTSSCLRTRSCVTSLERRLPVENPAFFTARSTLEWFALRHPERHVFAYDGPQARFGTLLRFQKPESEAFREIALLVREVCCPDAMVNKELREEHGKGIPALIPNVIYWSRCSSWVFLLKFRFTDVWNIKAATTESYRYNTSVWSDACASLALAPFSCTFFVKPFYIEGMNFLSKPALSGVPMGTNSKYPFFATAHPASSPS